METMQFYQQDAQKYFSENPLPSNLASIQKKYREKHTHFEIPNRKNDDWKYTNLENALKNHYSFFKQSSTELTTDKDTRFQNIYFLNGKLLEEKSELSNIEVFALSDIAPELIEEVFTREEYFATDFMTQFNRVNLEQGYYFKFAEKTHFQKTINIHHHYSGELSYNNQFNYYHFESGCEVNLLEEYTSDDNCGVNIANFIKIESAAQVEQISLQNLNNDSMFLQGHTALIKRDAHYNHVAFHTGSALSRNNLFIELLENGASCDAHGLYALKENQHHDTMSYIKHTAPHTESAQLYKGILADSSRGIFTGRVRVEKDAQQINAQQLNKNLLLSKKAQANSRPQMEINADDVKCAHGSTTGQLSEEELFYFQARGIDKDKASRMLAKAFAYDVVLKIKDKNTRDVISRHLHKKHIVS